MVLSTLEKTIVANGKVTNSEVKNAVAKLQARLAHGNMPVTVQRDIDRLVRKVQKISNSVTGVPTKSQLQKLKVKAHALTWKLAGIAWTLAKGHAFILATYSYGTYKGGVRGEFVKAIAAMLLFKQWELAGNAGKNWIKHKLQLALWQLMIKLLSLPVDIPVWLVKKINTQASSMKERKQHGNAQSFHPVAR